MYRLCRKNGLCSECFKRRVFSDFTSVSLMKLDEVKEMPPLRFSIKTTRIWNIVTREYNFVFCDIVSIFQDPRLSQCKDIETVSEDNVQDRSGLVASKTEIDKAKLYGRSFLRIHEKSRSSLPKQCVASWAALDAYKSDNRRMWWCGHGKSASI